MFKHATKRPGFGASTSTRSASDTASSKSWVMNTTVVFSAPDFQQMTLRQAACLRIQCAKGSSISNTLGPEPVRELSQHVAA